MVPRFMHSLPAGLAALLVAAGCGGRGSRAPGGAAPSALGEIVRRGVLMVGTEPEFHPFEYVDAQGELQGFDIDLARALAGDLGVAVRFETMSFDSLPTAIQNGRIDLIWSGMTATVERAKTLLFSDFYYRTGLCLLVSAGSGIQSAADADGKRLVVKLGTTGDVAAPRLFPRAAITKFENESVCAAEVVNGRADAFLYDRHSILRHHQQNPDTTRALLEPLSYEPYAVAMRQGDFVLCQVLNLFLARIHGDGRYEALYRKHFGTAPEPAL